MKNYSLLREMKKQGKISNSFEIQLSNLSLEEIIALKLEVAAKTVKGKFYGFPLYHALPNITKEAVFRWAVSICDTKTNASRVLGISLNRFNQIYKKLNFDKNP
jgi:hypothetical protein